MKQISVSELLNKDHTATIKIVGNKVIIDAIVECDMAIMFEGTFKVVPLGSKRIKALRERRVWDWVCEDPTSALKTVSAVAKMLYSVRPWFSKAAETDISTKQPGV